MEQLESMRIERDILELKEEVARLTGELMSCSRVVHALLASHPDGPRVLRESLNFETEAFRGQDTGAEDAAMESYERAAKLQLT